MIWSRLASRLADPVLGALVTRCLKATMPVEAAPDAHSRENFTHLAALGRLLVRLAPWLELGSDPTTVGRGRARVASLARSAVDAGTELGLRISSTFPKGPKPSRIPRISRKHCSVRQPSAGGKLVLRVQTNNLAALKTPRGSLFPMRFVTAILIGLFGCRAAAATAYHVDSRAGDDTHDGLAPDRAWRSLARVNATTFVPGDRILLRAGAVWEGAALQPRGSGTPAAPIVVDRYDVGPAPAIHGRGQVRWVLRLENQEGWDISNLELTNRSLGKPQQARAVEIRARDAGWLRHIHLTNLFIHDVNAVSDYRNDGDVAAKSFGGIALLIEGEVVPTAWDDLLVQGCVIRDVGPIGLVAHSSWMTGHRENDPRTWFPSRGVVIRGNVFERIDRNGMILRGCDRPLVEYNLWRECGRTGSGNGMFIFHCDDALVQFNEACFTRYNPGDSDAAGFDSDYNSRRTVFQFNYSHDNEYGFILICSLGGRANGFNDGTIVRYNISQNDGGAIVRVSGTVTNALVHNNTIYVKPGIANPREAAPPRILFHKSWQGWSDGVAYVNNIIHNDSREAVYELGESRNNRFEGNLFFGVHPASEPADPRIQTADPRLVRVGGATDRATAAADYALLPGSAAIGGGVALPFAAPHDYAGRPIVSRADGIDRGALVFVHAP